MDIIATRQTFLGEGGKRFIGMTQPWDFEGGSAHLSGDWAPRLVHRSTLAVARTEEGRELILSAQQPIYTTDVRTRHERADDAYE
jgi:hypothetical protein